MAQGPGGFGAWRPGMPVPWRPDGLLVIDSYARLSRNLSGLLEKTDDQHADNTAEIEALGARVGEYLTDDSLSAWDPNVYRKDFERLLERVESGDSDGCAVFNTDRLLRLPWDLERLIRLGEAGYIVLSPHGTRDLSDYEDRKILRDQASAAAKSSDQTSERIRIRFRNQRRRGILHTRGRTFGFGGFDHTVPFFYDEDTGDKYALDPETGERVERPRVSEELVKRERDALLDATREILAGESSLRKIVAAWNEAELRSTTGREWNEITFRSVLLRARNAGLVEHDGEIVGRTKDEPIVPVEEFERLRATFAARRRGRQPGNRYVGSGVLRCGHCGKTLSGKPHSGVYGDTGEPRRRYTCPTARGGRGKVSADMRLVDKALRELVLFRQSDRAHAAAIEHARTVTDTRLVEVERELAECRALAETIAEKMGRREMSPEAYDRAVEPLQRDITRLEAEHTALTESAPTGEAEVLTYQEAAARWDDAEVTEQRTSLRAAIGRSRVFLDPAARKGVPFTPERLRVTDPEHPAHDTDADGTTDAGNGHD